MNVANRLRGKCCSIEGAVTDENDRPRAAGLCGIAIMAKASVPGRTKTRLVPPLTFEQAAALNTAFLQDMATNLLLAGSYTAIAGYAAFTPVGSERVAAQTLERARELELEVHTLPTWYDVDDLGGLRRLHRELRTGRAGKRQLDPHAPHYSAATAALMGGLPVGELAETDPQIPIGSA
jgi:hypothetical protein